MQLMMKFAAAAVVALTALSAPAMANLKVGTLVCDVSGGIGLILGSKKAVHCTFKKVKGGEEHYSGSITKFGLDIGITKETVMVWVVLAPAHPGPGALAGSYAGVTAEATAGVGAGANLLVGGMENSISLQPLSVQGQTGLNLAAGVASLSLTAK